jgi:hypothetical protein
MAFMKDNCGGLVGSLALCYGSFVVDYEANKSSCLGDEKEGRLRFVLLGRGCRQKCWVASGFSTFRTTAA